MTTAIPHVSDQLVLSLYHDHPGDIFSCNGCGKAEPPDVEFAECGRCSAAYYCSKACQVGHWKNHKKRCPKIDGDESKRAYNKMDGRLGRFNGYFGPIVSKILCVRLALLKSQNDAATNKTHLMMLHLSELPEGAKKPRLRLDGVDTMAVADLPGPYRSHVEQGMCQYPRSMFVIPYICQVKFSGANGSMWKPGMTAFEANPLLDDRMPKRSGDLMAEGGAWIRIINDVAEGRREGLRRAIKERTKKNRARR